MKKMFCSRGPIGWAMGCTVLVSGVALGQVRTISGTITADQKPLQGVTVFEEGSATATTTNAQGHYQLRLSGKAPTVVMRHPDYPERRLKVGAMAVLDTDLVLKENRIEEVVLNAGYYKVKERESTGSISRITAKDIENQPVSNVLQAAQGRMAGVSIVQNSGVAGGGFKVEIRGRNSLRTLSNSGVDANQPLYIIDGVPIGGEVSSMYSSSVLPLASISPLNAFSPEDIEQIEVLKDADATAIYGSRGANGVVLLTTKRAKSKKLSLSVNSSYQLSQIISNLKMMNTSEYLSMRRQAFSNSGVSVYPATQYDINGKWDQQRDSDWQRLLIGHTATTSNTRLSLGGGGERTSFLASVGHNEQSTVFGEDFLYRNDYFSGNLSHHSEDHRFKLNSSHIFSVQKNNLINEDVTRQALILPPNAPALYKADGSLNWEGNTFTNPVAAYKATYSNENIRYVNSLDAQYEVFKNFLLKLNGGITYETFEEWSLRPNTIYNPAYAAGQSSAYSQAYKSDQKRLSFVAEPQVNWFMEKGSHRLDLLLGATYQQDVMKRGSMRGTGFESNSFIQNIAAAQTKVINDQISTTYKYAAFFGRVNYQLAGKYILNLTGRRDGSSRFGPNKKFANFGAIGAAWLFGEEGFAKRIKWLSFGKLRGSFGTTGSDQIGDYQFMDTFSVLSSSSYDGVVGIVPTRLFNPNFGWEKTTKIEVALEVGLLNDRVNLTTSWYRNRSSDQLVGYQLPSSTGFGSVNANLDAVVENKGVEIDAHVRIIDQPSFKWTTRGNISFPTNKLISFPGLAGSTYANTYMVGEPINILKLYHLEGINPQNGQYQFTDFNGDGKISSPHDVNVIANIGVEYFGGWSHELKYGNWDFSFLLQFVKQQSMNFNSSMTSPGLMVNLPKEVLDVWAPNHLSGYYMPYQSVVNPMHSLFQESDATVSDGSFIRLKNVQLSYRVPLGRSTFLKNVTVYAQGQNLWTWTKYFGVDPETGASSYLPPLKTYALGVQINL